MNSNTYGNDGQGSMNSDSDGQCAGDCETLKRHQELLADPDRHAKAMEKLKADSVMHQKALSTNKQLHGKVKKGLKQAFPADSGPTPFEKAGEL